MSRFTIRHEIGEIEVKTARPLNRTRLRRSIREALDTFVGDERVPASAVHDEAHQRYGEYYLTPGFNLRAYRYRSEMTQAALAASVGIRQHHISEMERNLRPIGKQMAQRLARILRCDYRRFL